MLGLLALGALACGCRRGHCTCGRREMGCGCTRRREGCCHHETSFGHNRDCGCFGGSMRPSHGCGNMEHGDRFENGVG